MIPPIISSSYVQQNSQRIVQQIKEGQIFICPTDTIYGISCDATNETAVQKIRNIKQRDTKPLSVWAPSKEWIRKHCEVMEDELDLLPGPYTLILRLKNKSVLAPSVLLGLDQVGVRIPNHWFNFIVEKLDLPLITTSVNIAGMKHATTIHQIPTEILQQVDFRIDEGEKTGHPSTIINTISQEIIRR